MNEELRLWCEKEKNELQKEQLISQLKSNLDKLGVHIVKLKKLLALLLEKQIGIFGSDQSKTL